MNSGSSTDIETAGTRLCRGYAMVAAELQRAHAPADAYMVGRDPDTKLEIIIAASPAAAARGREEHRFAKSFTPDEIARLIALDERAKKIAAVKAAFPGAEIVTMACSAGSAEHHSDTVLEVEGDGDPDQT
jgi:hypothetical protein